MSSKEKCRGQRPLEYHYWNTNHSSIWSILGYLKSTPAANSLDVYNIAIDSYLKELEGIADSDDQWGVKHKKKACSLLKSYRQGRDSERARAWRIRESVVQPASPPSLVINNSSGFAIGNHNSIAAAKPKRKPRKRRLDVDETEAEPTLASCVSNQTRSPSSFAKAYMEMDRSTMWELPSGAFAEEVLYDKFKNASSELLAHSFVIDIHDLSVKISFEPEDWQAILKKVLEWPENDQSLTESMKRFWKVKTPAELRLVLDTTSYLPKDESYDREKHYDRYWVQLVMAMLLPLLEDPDQVLVKTHHEAWYDINIWSVIVDRCLQDLKGMVILRGEPTSMASTLRKNRDRVDTAKRQRIGSRFDGLGQDECGKYEYVTMEAARTFESETCSKWLHDYQKVGKSLHDMLYRLQWLVNQEEKVMEKLQLVGLVSAGLHCQVVRVSYGSGHICLLSRDDLRYVPTKVPDLPHLLQLLLSVWRMKKMTRDCKATVDGYLNDSEGDLFDKLLQPPKLSGMSRPKIPMSCDTEDEGDKERQ